MNKTAIKLNFPDMQAGFARTLKEIRDAYLQDALARAVASLDLKTVDGELYQYADLKALALLASRGMRGELLFSVPCVLIENPRLLGYYRLLLGYSQKGFYTSSSGVGMFKSLEETGTLSKRQKDCLPELCAGLNQYSGHLLRHLETDWLSASFFDQLTLLTLGPQLRGGANVQRGASAILQVFDLILEIVKPAVVTLTPKKIELKNRAGRSVFIQFASDPDIVIRENLEEGIYRNLVAIEVKGGKDYSNIHNRVGEAEKSHQKAKKDGYVECWTIVNVDKIDIETAQKESPTTNRFYRMSGLAESSSYEYKDFVLQILSIAGI